MKTAACIAVSILVLAACATSVDSTPTAAEPDRMKLLEEENLRLREDRESARQKLNSLNRLFWSLLPNPPRVPPLPPEEGDRLVPPAILGLVMCVNQEQNRVILSVGRNAGVKVGYSFTVYRGDRYVATVVVDRVEGEHCFGHSERDVERTPIMVKDKAANRL